MNSRCGPDGLRAMADSLGLDAVVTVSPENFAYASGAFLMTAKEVRERLALAIVPRRGATRLIICNLEEQALRASGASGEIRCYAEFVEHPIDMLATLLKEIGLCAGRIGLDLDYLAGSSYDRLRGRLPALITINTSEEVALLRSIKTARDAHLLCNATRSTHHAVLDAMAESRCGDTERDLCLRIAQEMLRRGADTTHFLFLGSGERSGTIHRAGTEHPTKVGEIIHLDVGSLYDGFSTDFARTLSTGDPTAEQQDHYAAVLAIQQALIAALAPGVAAEDVYFLCRDEMACRGLQLRIPLVGHGLGREIHERPILRPGEKARLEVGMLINIEPAHWDESGNLYHLEDLVEITPSGAKVRSLGLAPSQIPVLGKRASS